MSFKGFDKFQKVEELSKIIENPSVCRKFTCVLMCLLVVLVVNSIFLLLEIPIKMSKTRPSCSSQWLSDDHFKAWLSDFFVTSQSLAIFLTFFLTFFGILLIFLHFRDFPNQVDTLNKLENFFDTQKEKYNLQNQKASHTKPFQRLCSLQSKYLARKYNFEILKSC